MDWEKILRDSVQNGSIKAVHLSRVPILKNCPNWREIEIVGTVFHEAANLTYRGVLVKLKGNLYFVQQGVFDAVQNFLKVKSIPRIMVIP
ncbi:MAG TPA: hypothetical protein VF857_02360 [Spirochaetota bacterium]